MSILSNCIRFLDIMIVIYLILSVVSGYGTVLFLWWAKKIGRPTSVYVYVTALLFGTFVNSAVNAYVRVIFLCSSTLQEYAEACLNTWWWPLRKLITLCAIVAIVFHMSYRVFYSRKKLDKELDKELDNKHNK